MNEMADLNRFMHHLDAATQLRRQEGIRGHYYLDPVNNRIHFIRSTPPKEGRHAVPKREATPLPVAETPGHRPPLGEEVRIDAGGREAEGGEETHAPEETAQ
jgi:hypothetical protein